MARTSRRNTAYHEAGHAVIGRVLDLDCGHATIVADHDSSGHAITEDPWVTAGRWEARYWAEFERTGKMPRYRDVESVFRARILTFMAGREAELELLGDGGLGEGDDRYQIELMAEQIPIPGAEDDLAAAWSRYEARLRRQARRLVRRHRERIERVAEALLKHGRLEAAELDALVKA